MSPITLLLLAGALQGSILSILLLLRPSRNPEANRALAAILLVVALSIGIHALAEWRYPADRVHYFVIGLLTVYSAPLTRFYALALARPPLRFRSVDLLHFLPFLALLAIGLALYLNGPAPLLETLFIVLFDASVLVYLLWSIVICIGHARLVRRNFSTIGRRSLRWLLVFLAVLVLVWGSMAVGIVVSPNESWDLLWAANCVLFFLIGLFGFQRPQFFESLEGMAIEREPPSRYRNSPLSREQHEQYGNRLPRVMSEKKPYLRDDLSLAGLAGMVGITPHQLSQFLNECLGTNFYDYVNGFRIREAQARLRAPDFAHQTISSIALELGFNSLSTFNRQFMAHVGTTPSRYRDEPGSD